MTELFIPVTHKLPLLMSQMLISKGKTQPNPSVHDHCIYTSAVDVWPPSFGAMVHVSYSTCPNLFSFSKKNVLSFLSEFNNNEIFPGFTKGVLLKTLAASHCETQARCSRAF